MTSIAPRIRDWRRRFGAFRDGHPRLARLDRGLSDLVWALLFANLAAIVVRELGGSHTMQLVAFCATFAGALGAHVINGARTHPGADGDEDRDEPGRLSLNGAGRRLDP